MDALLTLTLGLAFYFLPSIIAGIRGHHNLVPVILVNFLLGWSGVGWIAALVWSFTNQRQTHVYINNNNG